MKSLAATGALALSGCGGSEQTSLLPNNPEPQSTTPPNILFVLVDEMRYPVHFPAGIDSPDAYLARFMPNLYQHLWQGGVRFDNFRTAAGACTPSRGVLLTGMYSQQSWLITTITGPNAAGDAPPSLSTDYPTYGKLLLAAGYDTPYFGKFHVAADVPHENDECTVPIQDYLQPWGFSTYVCPDPGGTQGQGNSADGKAVGDREIADAAIEYFLGKTVNDKPWCATVSFVNPHDYEFFWAGTEPDTYMPLFEAANTQPLIAYDTSIVSESNPSPQGFPPLPSNWESFATLQANKPRSQPMFNEANQAIFGAVSFDPSSTQKQLEPSLILNGNVQKGVAPYSYWQRGGDSYVQMLGLVDEQIGRVLDSLSDDVRANTIVVFTSDHGDYVGSHGFSQGKVGTVYEEALRVPLIVKDYTGRFAREPEMIRNQLSSSVDLVRFLVTLGYQGDTSWIQGDLATLYGNRHDLLSVVRSSQASGRDFALYTTDEYVNPLLNYNHSPTHIIGLVQDQMKLGVYSYWAPGTTREIAAGRDLEFYDWTTPGGAAETDSQPNDPRVAQMLGQLLTDLVPNELQAPLPASLQAAQEASRQEYIAFVSILDDLAQNAQFPPRVAFSFGLDSLATNP